MLDKLALLKIDLQITAAAYDERLKQYLSSAEQMIRREGVMLRSTAEDDQLVIMYAAYLWRSRKESAPVMPRPLRFALNNRLFSQKAGVRNDGGCM